MALIRINIADSLVSESARVKVVSYKVAKVGGKTTLVVVSERKAELQAVVGLLKKAKTAAVSGMSSRIKAATAFTKAQQTPKGPRKTALRETYKTEKAKSSADIKQAKKLIKEANAHAKKHGFGGLNLPLSASDIVMSGPGLAKALKTVRGIKLTEFGITGKRGTFKPVFMKAEKLTAGKASTPATRKAKADAKAPSAKKRAAKKPVEMNPIALTAKVNKSLPKMLKTVGITFDQNKKSGSVKYDTKDLKGKAIGKNNIVMTELRMHLEDKNIPVQKTANGFEVPGVIKFTQGEKGVTFKRLDK